MKRSIKILMMICIVLGFSPELLQAQKKVETIHIEVSGVCDMCKSRIEESAINLKGVKLAVWDKKAQKLKVVYKTSKIEEDAIHKAIAKTGHDTGKEKASKGNYDKLPGCCQYRGDLEIH